MAHFARLNNDNIVINVIKVNDSDCVDQQGQESEQVGIEFLKALFGADTIWRQTSYNNNIRKNYACIGYRYDSELDAYISPAPYPSWTLNTNTCAWDPPVPAPEDISNYEWNETDQLWQQISTSQNT